MARVDLALLLLRVILAAAFGAHGYLKWAGGLGPLAGLMMTVHLPFPDFLARVSATLELGGAVLLLIGLWTRLIGALLAVEMAALAADVSLSIHPHPTLSETVMEAAEVFFGQATDVYRPKRG